jgi:hypothetical protein
VTPRDICQKAATIIEQRGHCKGELFLDDPLTGPVCLLGAIKAAIAPDGDATGVFLRTTKATTALYLDVVERLDGTHEFDLVAWNDAPSTTAADVITKLRAVP